MPTRSLLVIIPSANASSVKSFMLDTVVCNLPAVSLAFLADSRASLATVSSVYLLAKVQCSILKASPAALAVTALSISLSYLVVPSS